MNISVIFEDESFLVIEKPAGLVVNRADTTGKIETLQDWVEQKLKTQNSKVKSTTQNSKVDEQTIKEFESRSGIVHRLDKDTSGLLVIAKTPEAFENLKSQFKGREVVKKYLALVHGQVEPSEGTVNAPIERNPFNRMHFGIFPGGREAVTEYRTIKNVQFAINNVQLMKQLNNETMQQFTLLELTPHTGRTHQIRVHMKYINHPLVSDPIYGGRKNYRDDLKFCPRLFLHATYLKIKDPTSGDVLEFNSHLPSDLDAVLSTLLQLS